MSVHLSGTVNGALPAYFGDPGRLEHFAGRLDALADEVQGLGTDACEATTGIAAQANWSGNAAEAYLNYCRSKSAAVASLSDPLHEIAAAVRGYAAVLEAQQHRAHSAVRSVDGITDPTAEAHRIMTAQSQIAEATDELQRAVYQASGRAEEAKNRLELFREDVGDIREAEEKVMWPWELLLHAPFYLKLLKPTEDVARWLDTEWRVDPAVRRGVRTILGEFKTLEYGMAAIGLAGDVMTIISPGDKGVLGDVDRGVAIAQGAAIAFGATMDALAAANMLDEVPVVGEVVMAVDIGAGIYFGAKYVSQIPAVHHALDSVGHASVSVLKSGVRFASGVEHQVTSSVRSLFRL